MMIDNLIFIILKRIFNISFLFTIIVSLFFSLSTPVQALYTFEENFDTSWQNRSKWNIYENGGIVSIKEGSLNLSSNNTDGFPFITTNQNIFPSGNFEIEWKFKYLQQLYGTGFAITDVLPVNRTTKHPNRVETIISSWAAVPNKIALNFALCPEGQLNCTIPGPYIPNDLISKGFFTVKVKYVDKQYTVFLDGNQVFKSGIEARVPQNIWIGNPLDPPNPLTWSPLSIDYIKITALPDKQLGVPEFYQTDPLWAGKEYDSANTWKATYPNMKGLGCAITSASMILRYYGIDKLPDGRDVNPDTINQYLKETPGGYVGEGMTNWSVIAAMTKKSNTKYGTTKLEFVPSGWNTTKFQTDITNGKPGIVSLADYWGVGFTHFFVGTGYNSDTLYINDPLNKKTNLPLNKNFSSYRFFYPTNSDFSAMMFTIHDGVNPMIIDNQNRKLGRDANGIVYQEIPNALYSFESPAVNPELDGPVVTDKKRHVFELTHLVDAKYTLKVYGTSGKVFNIDSFFQTTDATSQYKPISRYQVATDGDHQFDIQYTKNTQSKITATEDVTVDYIKKVVQNSYNNKLIYKKATLTSLLNRLDDIKRLETLKKTTERNKAIGDLMKIVDRYSADLDATFAQQLKDLLNTLLNGYANPDGEEPVIIGM